MPYTAPESIRVFSPLLDSGHECNRLWHITRAFDVAGSGCFRFHIEAMAGLLGCSVRTIHRHIQRGLGTWFRGAVRQGKWVTLYYSGVHQVREALGLSGLGAIAEVELSHLGRSQAKGLATYLAALLRQRQAYYAARKGKSNQAKKRVLKPWTIAESAKSPGSPVLEVVTNGFQVPGCSIAGLAKATDWSQSTIKRRLNNRWRLDRGIEPITKRRIATELDDPVLLFELRESKQSFLVTENALGHTRVLKVLNSSASLKVLTLGCNVYAQDIQLLRCGRLRSKAKSNA